MYQPVSPAHSLRKSFAQRVYDKTGDVFTVQEMLGHKSIATTQECLGVNYASVRDAVQKMSLDGELHERLLGTSLKKTPNETLLLELALRGFDLSSLQDAETTAQILKISYHTTQAYPERSHRCKTDSNNYR